MKIQLALDRITIKQATALIELTEPFVDLVEVGTSLIKQYGMESIHEIKKAFPLKTIVADIKTIDNATYESKMSFEAGADITTVMGVSPIPTIEKCIEIAEKYDKQIMIDLLNTSEKKKKQLYSYAKKHVIFCHHVSKDEQELSGGRVLSLKKRYSNNTAIAGGITLEALPELAKVKPEILIVGSAITKADNPRKIAKQFQRRLKELW